MKKMIWIVLCCTLCACTSSQEKEAQGTSENDKGEVTTATVKFDGDKITEVAIDETTGDTTKKQLGAQYNMKQASVIGKEWYEQVAFLEKYIEKNGVANIRLNEEGKAENEDILTGCTIRIDGFLNAINQAKEATK